MSTQHKTQACDCRAACTYNRLASCTLPNMLALDRQDEVTALTTGPTFRGVVSNKDLPNHYHGVIVTRFKGNARINA